MAEMHELRVLVPVEAAPNGTYIRRSVGDAVDEAGAALYKTFGPCIVMAVGVTQADIRGRHA